MSKKQIINIIEEQASDILNSKNMQMEKSFIQHGNTSVFDHSLSVAVSSLKLAKVFRIKVDEKSLIRGCLLHDYFLYDWHDKDSHDKHHGFKHAKVALDNALKEYDLSDIEKNMIYSHMFPLNLRLPKYKESILLCLTDKTCASKELITYFGKNLLKLSRTNLF